MWAAVGSLSCGHLIFERFLVMFCVPVLTLASLTTFLFPSQSYTLRLIELLSMVVDSRVN